MDNIRISMKENPGLFKNHPSRNSSDISVSVIIPDLPTPLGNRPNAAKFGKESYDDFVSNFNLPDPEKDSFSSSNRFSSSLNPISNSHKVKLYSSNNLSLNTKDIYSQYSSAENSSATISKFPTSPFINPKNSFSLSSSKDALPATKNIPSPLQNNESGYIRLNTSSNSSLRTDSEAHSILSHSSTNKRNSKSTTSINDPNIIPLRSSEYSSNSEPSSNFENSQNDNQTIRNMKLEESNITRAKRQETLSLSKSILTDKQKIAYVGLVYLVLVEMQSNLGVQYKEAISSTTSFMKFSKRVMDRIYSHISISAEEQKMIEQLPRHRILPSAMAKFLRSEGETVSVKTENQLTVSHAYSKSNKTNQILKSKSENPIEPLSPNLNPISSTKSLSSLNPSSSRTLPPQLSLPKPESSDSIEEKFSVIPASTSLNVDISATLIIDLLLLLLNDEVFDSRGRYLLRRVGEALNYSNTQILLCERRVTKQLSLFDYAAEVLEETEKNSYSHSKVRPKQSLAKRIAIVGLATVGGGLVIGLSAGLLAPAIGAGIGATLGAIGVANAGTFFGSIGGSVLITTSGVLTGSSLAGVKISRRIRNVDEMKLIMHNDDKSTNVIFTIPGWITSPALLDSFNNNGEFSSSSNKVPCKIPFELLDPIHGDVFSLIWDENALLDVGASFKLLASELASTTVMQTLQYTVLQNLLGPLSIPMWLAKLGYILDNPWSTGFDLAQKAGPLFADALFNRVQGCRPVTLIGFSLGGLLIFECLKELAKMMAFGIIEDVIIFGAPIVASEQEWRIAKSVVGGRFINGFSGRDWLLKLMYRTANIGMKSIAGLQEIKGISGVENVDLTSDVSSHMAYFKKTPLILQQLGYSVTRLELDVDEDEEKEIENVSGDRVDELFTSTPKLEESAAFKDTSELVKENVVKNEVEEGNAIVVETGRVQFWRRQGLRHN
ncbi:putative membrane protein [Smittium culicis]|uniref:Putative membrane protein n=1 Tax=Smittium culicis TaxID=133412 RepID=A0A1R1YNY9_9FUNG|nr:putative membrane protein [Smittium culicis]